MNKKIIGPFALALTSAIVLSKTPVAYAQTPIVPDNVTVKHDLKSNQDQVTKEGDVPIKDLQCGDIIHFVYKDKSGNMVATSAPIEKVSQEVEQTILPKMGDTSNRYLQLLGLVMIAGSSYFIYRHKKKLTGAILIVLVATTAFTNTTMAQTLNVKEDMVQHDTLENYDYVGYYIEHTNVCEITKDVPKEIIKEVPVEIIKEVPVEKIKEIVKEVPVEVIKEIPVEIIKEVPVEKIKEIVKIITIENTTEIPIEVIKEIPVEVIKEVPVEKIKEVIKEVPVEVIKEVVREVPVEKIKEVIKEVPVEKIKEVPIEVIKEIPVEVIKEVVREVPVEVIKEVTKERVIESIPYDIKIVVDESLQYGKYKIKQQGHSGKRINGEITEQPLDRYHHPYW